MPEQLLADRVVVITGAARGLGAAHARACAAEGARLVLTDIDEAELDRLRDEIANSGSEAVAIVVDISEWASCQAIVDLTLATYGRIDGLVNNAAIVRNHRPFEETEEEIRAHYGANVFGTYFLSVIAGPRMSSTGSIVNTVSGAHSGMRFSGMYASTKGAIASLTYSWANDLASSGSKLRVNAISPHAHTRLLDAGAEYYAKNFGSGLNVVGPDPATNSSLVVYLLSEESAAVNGQVVRIEGGKILSVNTHPAILAPPLYRESWTPRDIANAFETVFADRLQPLGLAYVESHVVPAPEIADLPAFDPTKTE